MSEEIKRLVITDLTRFNNNFEVCTAGIDMDTGNCIRLWPYLKKTYCVAKNIEPGAIFSGIFSEREDRDGPHQEDMTYDNLKLIGKCETDEFKQALSYGMFNSIEEGFEINLSNGSRCIPYTQELKRSILSIKISPASINLIEDTRFDKYKLKFRVTDMTGRTFDNMPITDLGFFEYAKQNSEKIADINKFIHSQEEVILRVGLARRWKQPDTENDGYWIQVNGLYTFPDYLHEIRSY